MEQKRGVGIRFGYRIEIIEAPERRKLFRRENVVHYVIMVRRETKTLSGRCFNITGKILSRPEAQDFLETMAKFNSVILKSFVSM